MAESSRFTDYENTILRSRSIAGDCPIARRSGLDRPPRGARGIVGESGCGKTTLAKVVMGLVTPDAGRIVFEGRETVGSRRRENFRRQARMVFRILCQSGSALYGARGSEGSVVSRNRCPGGREKENAKGAPGGRIADDICFAFLTNFRW